jgi:hypothetical protein
MASSRITCTRTTFNGCWATSTEFKRRGGGPLRGHLQIFDLFLLGGSFFHALSAI